MTPARTMSRTLFHCGLLPRLAAAALYGTMAFGAVTYLDPADADRAPSAPMETIPSPGTAAMPRATLCLESLVPVTGWDVRVDGAPVAPFRSDATTWLAELALGPGAALVVDASPAGDPRATRNAVRIRIAGTTVSRDQTFWLERDWSVATRVDRLAPATAPIEPEDLP